MCQGGKKIEIMVEVMKGSQNRKVKFELIYIL